MSELPGLEISSRNQPLELLEPVQHDLDFLGLSFAIRPDHDELFPISRDIEPLTATRRASGYVPSAEKNTGADKVNRGS